MATSIWHTKIRDIHQESILLLINEFLTLRGWPLIEFEGSTLFSLLQACYKTVTGKMVRIPAKSLIPHGILDTRIEKTECRELLALLQELGSFKSPAMALKLYSGSKVIVFLNDYFCKKTPKQVPLYYRY